MSQAHDWVFQGADADQATFKCSICDRVMAFVLPGLGEPSAVLSGDSWAVPEDANSYVDPCTQPEPPPEVPLVITKRQFLIQLVRSGMVSPSEADTLAIQPPALMSPILAAMPTEQALEARIGWAAMTQVERYSPLVLAAAEANNISSQDLDLFFIAAGEI